MTSLGYGPELGFLNGYNGLALAPPAFIRFLYVGLILFYLGELGMGGPFPVFQLGPNGVF